jgi:hypothetical protein
MDFSATIDLIIKDLKEASDIIDDLKKYPGVPVLQVELAKMKCRSAGEVIAMLKTLKDNPSFAEKEPVPQKKVQKQAAVAEEKPLPKSPVIIPTADEIKEETLILEIEPSPVVKEPESVKVHQKEQESSILADRFSKMSNTLYDQLGTLKSEDEIADILNKQPIASLADAIGVNDKFLFIREIFNGSQADYLQAITRLESTENITDARAVIMSYTGDNNESEAVLQLLDLVKRKLPSHE